MEIVAKGNGCIGCTDCTRNKQLFDCRRVSGGSHMLHTAVFAGPKLVASHVSIMSDLAV